MITWYAAVDPKKLGFHRVTGYVQTLLAEFWNYYDDFQIKYSLLLCSCQYAQWKQFWGSELSILVASSNCFLRKRFLVCSHFHNDRLYAQYCLYFSFSLQASGSISSCEDFTTPNEEGSFNFCDTSRIIFGMGATDKPIDTLIEEGAVTSRESGSFVILTTLHTLCVVFVVHHALITVCSLESSVTFFNWHPFLSSKVLFLMPL